MTLFLLTMTLFLKSVRLLPCVPFRGSSKILLALELFHYSCFLFDGLHHDRQPLTQIKTLSGSKGFFYGLTQ